MKKKNEPKSVLVIGMGRFGKHLALKMQELGNSVMVVDAKEKMEDDISLIFDDYLIGDCTNSNVVSSLGVEDFDLCFVTIGTNFEASIIITSLLKNFGAKYIVTKVSRDIQTDVLKKIGVNDIVYPEREYAEKLAIRYSESIIYDFFDLTSEYSIFEIAVPSDWIDKSIKNLNIRQKHKVNILVIKNAAELKPIPDPDYIFRKGDVIVLIGKNSDVNYLSATS